MKKTKIESSIPLLKKPLHSVRHITKLKHSFIKKSEHNAKKLIIGWQEWCALPKLHIPAIKAKIDTGAKTSALHAWDIRPFHRQGELYVHFIIHPLQRDVLITTPCTARVVDKRVVMNSGGIKESRYIIHTTLSIKGKTWDIEIGLTNRDPMAFRMLLGRDALQEHWIIDPGKKMCHGTISRKEAYKLYLKGKKEND